MTSILHLGNNYYKNGIFWFTKIVNKVVGETFYNKMRMKRRIISNIFYYQRQQFLHRVFIEAPDVACLWGIYPKVDTSHGFGYPQTYEMYRDFQENTINSDGSFGMWIVYIGAIYLIHVFYTYLIPYRWRGRLDPSRLSGGDEFFRLKDALSTTIWEDTIGLQYAEYAFNPHDFHSVRTRLQMSLSGPDDVRTMHMGTMNRKNRYVEHYMERAGDQSHMIISN